MAETTAQFDYNEWFSAAEELSQSSTAAFQTLLDILDNTPPVQFPDPSDDIESFPIGDLNDNNFSETSQYYSNLDRANKMLAKRFRAASRAAQYISDHRNQNGIRHFPCHQDGDQVDTSTSTNPEYCFWCTFNLVPSHFTEYMTWANVVTTSLSIAIEGFNRHNDQHHQQDPVPRKESGRNDQTVVQQSPHTSHFPQQQSLQPPIPQQEPQQRLQKHHTPPPQQSLDHNVVSETPSPSTAEAEALTRLSHQLLSANTTIRQLTDEIRALQQQNEELKSDRLSVEQRAAELARDNMELRRNNDGLKQLADRYNIVASQFTTLQKDNMALQARYDDLVKTNAATRRPDGFSNQHNMPPRPGAPRPPAPVTRTNNMPSAAQSRPHDSVSLGAGGGGGGGAGGTGKGDQARTHIGPIELLPDGSLPEPLQGLEIQLIEAVLGDLISGDTGVTWDDVIGLKHCKQAIQQSIVWPMLAPERFKGLRAPSKGLLLFGPPGTGKTMLGKAIARECGARFFSVSASSLTSKWMGQGEKMVRTLFTVCRFLQPCVLFIDEIDSLLTTRNENEQEGSRRIKTELLVQMDGINASSQNNQHNSNGSKVGLVVIGATNLPAELDNAASRRLPQRLYVPLPGFEARLKLFSHLLKQAPEGHTLTEDNVKQLARETRGYSAADIQNVCQSATMIPINELTEKYQDCSLEEQRINFLAAKNPRPLDFDDFFNTIKNCVKATVDDKTIDKLYEFQEKYGSAKVPKTDEEEEDLLSSES